MRKKVILAFLILLFLLTISFCHKPEPELIPIGDARVIAKTDDGNFIVTPAFVKLIHDLAYKVKRLELELEKCREKD